MVKISHDDIQKSSVSITQIKFLYFLNKNIPLLVEDPRKLRSSIHSYNDEKSIRIRYIKG